MTKTTLFMHFIQGHCRDITEPFLWNCWVSFSVKIDPRTEPTGPEAGNRYPFPVPDVILRLKSPGHYTRIQGPDIITRDLQPGSVVGPSAALSSSLSAFRARSKKAGVNLKARAMELIEKRRRSTRENSASANPGYNLYGEYHY